MADKLFRIAITAENITPLETQFITMALLDGWDMVHLRHPSESLLEMRRLIESIPQHLHRRLRLHGHFGLLNSFNLGGIHLNRRCPVPPEGYSGPMSRSCHSIDEVQHSGGCDYVTLSPIFDSISKPGYNAAFTENEILKIDKNAGSVVNTKVIALGGVSPQRVQQVKELGFDGFAVLGSLMASESIDDFRSRLQAFNSQT